MHLITIVGTGLGRAALTRGAMDALCSGGRVLLRTGRCACAEWLHERGIPFETLDHLYEQAGDFDQLSEAIVNAVKEQALGAEVIYAVPDVRDQATVRLLGERGSRLLPGVPLDAALHPYAQGPVLSLAACDCGQFQPEADQDTMIREIFSRQAASELKLRLLERYPPEHQIRLLYEDGTEGLMPLHALDRLKEQQFGHGLCALVPKVTELGTLSRYGFNQLNRVIRILRGPGGCPWDIKQTHQSLRSNLIEEAYEVADAIDSGDSDALYDELGDLLLQVVLHAEIARQHGEFGIDDVTSAISAKMIARHAHIFGEAKAETADEVLLLWEKIKREERKQQDVSDAMKSVTRALPQLMRATKVQKKAAQLGFDWDAPGAALEKVFEEARELAEAIDLDQGVAEEMGDLLFACVNVARLLGLEGEHALSLATDKFIARFAAMERLVAQDDKRLEDMNLAQMDAYWARIKGNHVKP